MHSISMHSIRMISNRIRSECLLHRHLKACGRSAGNLYTHAHARTHTSARAHTQTHTHTHTHTQARVRARARTHTHTLSLSLIIGAARAREGCGALTEGQPRTRLRELAIAQQIGGGEAEAAAEAAGRKPARSHLRPRVYSRAGRIPP